MLGIPLCKHFEVLESHLMHNFSGGDGILSALIKPKYQRAHSKTIIMSRTAKIFTIPP
jgi:hypothetical protein